MGVNGEALQLHVVYKYFFTSHVGIHIRYCRSMACENLYQNYKSRENLYQVLQVMHTASERAIKLKVHMMKSLSPQYQAIPEKNMFVAVGNATRGAQQTATNL